MRARVERVLEPLRTLTHEPSVYTLSVTKRVRYSTPPPTGKNLDWQHHRDRRPKSYPGILPYPDGRVPARRQVLRLRRALRTNPPDPPSPAFNLQLDSYERWIPGRPTARGCIFLRKLWLSLRAYSQGRDKVGKDGGPTAGKMVADRGEKSKTESTDRRKEEDREGIWKGEGQGRN